MKWEYLQVRSERQAKGFDDKLGPMGERGWELVSVVADTISMSGETHVAYLKRPVPEIPDIPIFGG